MADPDAMDIDNGVMGMLCAYFDTVSWLNSCIASRECVSRLIRPGAGSFKPKVIGQKNLGDHINEICSDRSVMRKAGSNKTLWKLVLQNNVLDHMFINFHFCLKAFLKASYPPSACQALDDLVMSLPDPDGGQAVTTLVPNSTVSELWLPLHVFDFSPNGKNGCRVLPKYNHHVVKGLFDSCLLVYE